jgi:hypothetical protein
MAQESPYQITKILENEAEETTPLYRQTSLIPAYRYDDTINDLELENLLGTPYTCEIAVAKKKLAKKNRNKVKPVAKEVEQLQKEEEEEVFFTPLSTAAAPPLPTAAEKYNALSVEEDVEINEIRVCMKSMSLDKSSLSTYTTIATSNEVNNCKEDSSGLFLGNAGSHIRFSPRNKMYLRGVPQPTGTHTTFDNE